jgi:hypothetical protein
MEGGKGSKGNGGGEEKVDPRLGGQASRRWPTTRAGWDGICWWRVRWVRTATGGYPTPGVFAKEFGIA